MQEQNVQGRRTYRDSPSYQWRLRQDALRPHEPAFPIRRVGEGR